MNDNLFDGRRYFFSTFQNTVTGETTLPLTLVRRAIGWFGPERCMFGSDWPVCLLAAPYGDVVKTMRSIVGENPNVFGGTAARVYGLDD